MAEDEAPEPCINLTPEQVAERMVFSESIQRVEFARKFNWPFLIFWVSYFGLVIAGAIWLVLFRGQ